MESYELYLTDKHHLTCCDIVIDIAVQIDKAPQVFQLLLFHSRQTNLSQTGYRNMVDGLNDAVAFIFGNETDDGIPRTTLVYILRHKLEHKRVALIIRGVHFHREVIAVHRRIRHQQQVRPTGFSPIIIFVCP